jgi:CheY-like chemotaxis protein
MSADVLTRALEPFFTTKDVGKGSGLGLSQVLGFAKQSGGGLRVESEPERGTSVHIYLPRSALKPAEPDAAPAPAAVSSQSAAATILIVDDDNAVREVTASILREVGHRVLEAGSGGAALEILQRETSIELLLVDLAMPGMSGAELARRVQTKRPELPVLFVTGFANRAALEGVSETRIIGKPFSDADLSDRVRLALAGEMSPS